MIEWRVYDNLNPPELNKEFLIYDHNYKQVRVARLEEYDEKLMWIEVGTAELNNFVTHYAELNVP